MSRKAIVLDANILIRAVLGKRVRELILQNAATVKFFTADVAYSDARKYLPSILAKRGIHWDAPLALLSRLESIVQSVTPGCPVWTEDADFFGTGVATWTSDRIALYFSS